MAKAKTAAFGVCGPISSGKTTVARVLNELVSGQILSFGELITKEAMKRALVVDRGCLVKLGEQLIAEIGYIGITETLLKEAKGDGPFVVEGIRHRAVVDVLKTKFQSEFFLIYVDAPIEIRFNRALARGKYGSHLTRQSFAAEEKSGLENGVFPLRELADGVIDNSATCLDLERLRSDLLTLLGESKSTK